MFEYILLIQVCSELSKVCMESTKYPKHIKTRHECLVKGYDIGLEISKSLKAKDVNNKKLFVNFSCIEVEKNIS